MVESLLDAAIVVFDRDGFTAATMTAVAAEAGVGIASLYQWFPSKEDLLAGLTERHLADASARLLAVAEQLRADLPDAAGVVATYVRAVVAANENTVRLERELLSRFPRTDEVLALLAAVEDAAVAEVVFHLDRLVLGRPDRELAAHILVKTVETLVHEVVLVREPGADRDRAEAEVRSLVLAYLGVPS